MTTLVRTFLIGSSSSKKDKVSKVAKIRNRYNQVPHLTKDTNGKVTNSQKTPQTRAKRSVNYKSSDEFEFVKIPSPI